MAHRSRAADGQGDPGHLHRGVREEVPRLQGQAAGPRLGRPQHQAPRRARRRKSARSHAPQSVHDRVALHQGAAAADGRADPRAGRER
ncbi:MAG: hypothetical protein DMD96_35335, partial [Candidatus Rokuibacteriota bacterium]